LGSGEDGKGAEGSRERLRAACNEKSMGQGACRTGHRDINSEWGMRNDLKRSLEEGRLKTQSLRKKLKDHN